MAAAALLAESLTKSFNGKRALAGADLEVRPGEIHGLVGQNGSGKSTLIKILAGYYTPDDGTVSVHGAAVALGHQAGPRAAGLRFIHQDLGLVAELSAVDNLALGEPYEGKWWLSDRRERRAARALLRTYDVDIDVDVPVISLSPARQTFVAIVRALRSGLGERNVLVLDEPTAALPDREVEHLFGMLRSLRAGGVTILLVTHRLSEILDLADRVTVLRDGSTVATADVADLTYDSLAELIIGRAVDTYYPDPPTPSSHAALEVRGLSGGGVRDATFTVHRGEIVGVAGVVGSGFETLLPLVFGSVARDSGEVEVDGTPVPASPSKSVQAGLIYAPADRKRLSAILPWTLRENITLPSLRAWRQLWLSERQERVDAASWLSRLEVQATAGEEFWKLSGGNQQRVVLARWLRHGAKVLLFDEPTNGVDIGARQLIYLAMAAAAKDGAAFLMACSDTEELAAVCDRVLVIRDGQVAAELHGAQLSVDVISAEVLRSEATATSPGGVR